MRLVNIAGLEYGVLQGWPSPTLPLLRANETAVGNETLTVEQESWIGSLLFLGALVSSPIYSYINQNFGRKATGYLTTVPLIIGWLMIIFAESIMIISIARFILGFSMSGINIFLSMYVGEIAEDNIRGVLGSLRSVTADLGIVLIYLVAPYLSIRMTGVMCISMPVLFLFSYFWLPESPMFLLWEGKSEEAKKAYLWLRGGDAQAAEEEMTKLKAAMKDIEAEKEKPTTKEILSIRGTRKALLIAFILAIAQQFSGLNVMFTYSETVFEMTGSTLSPQMSSLIFGSIGLCGSLSSSLCSDLLGRRLILYTTHFLQGLCLGVLGVYLYARELGVDVSVMGAVPVITVSLYCFFAVAGTGNLYYVVISEIFRPEARGLAMNFSSSTMWILAFLSTKFYPVMVDGMGTYGCFFLFAAVSFAGAIYIYFELPETKNRSLDSILRELNGDSPEDRALPT